MYVCMDTIHTYNYIIHTQTHTNKKTNLGVLFIRGAGLCMHTHPHTPTHTHPHPHPHPHTHTHTHLGIRFIAELFLSEFVSLNFVQFLDLVFARVHALRLTVLYTHTHTHKNYIYIYIYISYHMYIYIYHIYHISYIYIYIYIYMYIYNRKYLVQQLIELLRRFMRLV